MGYFVIDVESDGPIPHKYSMVCFGAVYVENPPTKTFYGRTKPISDTFDPEALAISGFTREQHLLFPDPKEVMVQFDLWVSEVNTKGRPIFVSDNVAYDWQWINYYTHYYLGKNPFGWSGRRIGDLVSGLERNMYSKWKHLRKTKHTHDPVDDAKGNAEALVELSKRIKGIL